jgi:threonine dehydrogenase-like Zn-dependent dehydrogenase
MRWTTRTNLALCMRLIAEGKVNVDLLTTHRIPLERVEEETGRAMKKPETMLGVIFNPA